ncbi:MAG: hypothetical protein K0R12_1209 [Gammaproteobacteria bacterium]|jgi:hypothetical protein|nr:hypothetical protein [Gammaproteobacteria bacterium]
MKDLTMGKKRSKHLDTVNSQQTLGVQQKKNTEVRINTTYHQYKRDIFLFLYKGKPLVEMTMFRLESLQEIELLDFYLKDTKYDVFHWGLQHNCPKLIVKLVDLIVAVSPRRAFLMVSNNNYLAFKQFINELLQLDIESDKEIIAIKCAILKKIITINPYDIYHNVIEKIVNGYTAQNPTAILPKPFEEIVSELKKEHGTTLSSAGVSLFASTTNGNKETRFTENKNPNHSESSNITYSSNDSGLSTQMGRS